MQFLLGPLEWEGTPTFLRQSLMGNCYYQNFLFLSCLDLLYIIYLLTCPLEPQIKSLTGKHFCILKIALLYFLSLILLLEENLQTGFMLNAVHQFSSVQLLSRVWLFATPGIAACQASLSSTISWSFAQVHIHWVGDAI